ncbi:MAG TPA: TonB-dependent receptor [Polyangiaceae bacterium]|jgi:outer membrane receptor protein involved in Fe transport
MTEHSRLAPRRLWRSILVVVGLLLCFAPRATADNLADEADLQFKLGAAAYQKGDFTSALEHFLASNRLVPNRNVVFNIARTYEELHVAPDAYRYYVDAAQGETRADQKQRIEEALRRVAPSVAVLKVTTDPPGAAVYLDRKDLGARGNTPANLGLAAGKHKVIVELSGYEGAEKNDVELVIGREQDISFTLVPILGTVHVEGEAGATVRLDDVSSPIAGTVPCNIQVKPGRHTLIVEKLGYAEEDLPIDVPPRGTVSARAHLSAETGAVVVNTDIRDALITIDDQPSGFTPAVLNVPIGHHRLKVTLSGFRPIEQSIDVSKQGQVKLDLSLTTAEEVTAASRYTESIEDAPASVTIITAQELRAMNYPTIAEAVRGVRGIYLSNDTSYDTIGVRGFSRPGDYGNRILILVDGHPANDDYIWSSYVGFDGRTDIDDIERIEIIRGPGSVLYGTSAFFGVINLVTRSRDMPTHGEAKVDTVLGAGRGRVTGYWRAGKDAGAWMSVASAHSGGDTYHFEELRTGSNVPGNNTAYNSCNPGGTDYYGLPCSGDAAGVDGFNSFTVNGRVWWKSLTLQWFLTTRKKFLPAGEYATTFLDPNTNFTDTRGFLEARFEPQLTKTTQLFVRAHLDMYNFDDLLGYPSVANGGTGDEVDTFRGRWGGLEARVQYSGEKLRLMAGGEIIDHFQTLQEGVNAVQPVLFDNNGNAGRNDPFFVGAGYLNADIVPVPAFKISAGARVDYYSSIVNPQFLDVFNPRLALIIKPSKRDTLKLMAGKAFRAPSVYELYYQAGTQFRAGSVCLNTDTSGCDLKPEQIYSAEVEYSHRFSPTVTGLVSAYTNYVTNLVELDNVSDAGGNYENEYRNSANPVFVVGGEAEVRREWRQGWMLSGSVSVSRAGYVTTVDDPGGRTHQCIGLATSCAGLGEVPNSPLVLAAIKGAVPIIGRQLMLMSRLSFEGERYDNAIAVGTGAPQGTTDPGLIWDIVFSGEIERLGVRYAVGAYNVMDWQYQAVPSVEFAERVIPQRGRSFLASVSASF